MATWWKLEIEGEPTDEDREHIAEMVREGFWSGQLVDDEAWDGDAAELRNMRLAEHGAAYDQ